MTAAERNHRFAGACVGLASAVLLLTISAYLMLVADEGSTGSNAAEIAAQHMIQNAALLKALWLAEAGALSLLAVSGFVLQSRQASTTVPTGWFWTAFGLGAAINTLMYAFTLGFYPEAAAAVGSEPAVFQSSRGASYFIFFLANALMMLGLAGAYVGEAICDESVLPRWLGWVGAVFSAISFVGAVVGLIIGASVVAVLGPAALIATLITSLFGFKLAANG